jgi:hypothetical protein
LVELECAVGPYPAGSTWAEPSVEHAAELLRYVFEEPAEAAAVGARAAADIAIRYSEAAVGELMRQRLEVIAGRNGLSDYRSEMRSFFRAYKRLLIEVRDTVHQCVPPGASVLVVSRGEPELTELGDMEGRHFPANEDGVYCGYHPKDSAAAISALDAARSSGATHIVFPGTAQWWLQYYEDFFQHLNATALLIWNDARCLIYDLRGSGPVAAARKARP